MSKKIFDPSFLISIDKRLLFILFCAIALIVTYLTQLIVSMDKLFYNTFSEQLTYDRIDTIIDNQAKWAWLKYVLLPIFYLIKFSLISCCLYIATILMTSFRVSLSNVFGVVMIAEIVFLIAAITKVVCMIFINKDLTLIDYQYFTPLSLLNLLEIKTISNLWLYPLQSFNLFELIYCLSLAYLLKYVTKSDFDLGLRIVMSSYVPAFAIWITLIVFLSVLFNI